MSGSTVGEGIKKTPAYETPLSKVDLDKWRNEFWGKSILRFLYGRDKNIRFNTDLAAVEECVRRGPRDSARHDISLRSAAATELSHHSH